MISETLNYLLSRPILGQGIVVCEEVNIFSGDTLKTQKNVNICR